MSPVLGGVSARHAFPAYAKYHERFSWLERAFVSFWLEVLAHFLGDRLHVLGWSWEHFLFLSCCLCVVGRSCLRPCVCFRCLHVAGAARGSDPPQSVHDRLCGHGGGEQEQQASFPQPSTSSEHVGTIQIGSLSLYCCWQRPPFSHPRTSGGEQEQDASDSSPTTPNPPASPCAVPKSRPQYFSPSWCTQHHASALYLMALTLILVVVLYSVSSCGRWTTG